MNYYKIGQRIRAIRKEKGLSQAELAERVNVSTTHMSHIETGHTKLSLPVFVALARALEVRLDDLMEQPIVRAEGFYEDVNRVLDTCSQEQAQVIADVVKTLKSSMDGNLK